MTAIWPTHDQVIKAAQNGDLSYLHNLINVDGFKDILLNAFHKKSGDTLLHIAVRHDHLSLLKFLIREGLNPETGNFDGKTALHEGAQYESIHSVKHLLSLGVKIDALKRADWYILLLNMCYLGCRTTRLCKISPQDNSPQIKRQFFPHLGQLAHSLVVN